MKTRVLLQVSLGLILWLINVPVSGQILVYDSDMNFKCSYELIGQYETIVELWLENMPKSSTNPLIQKKVYPAKYRDENDDGSLYERGSASVKFYDRVRGTQHWVQCQIKMPPIYRADGSVALEEWVMSSSGVYDQTITANGRKYNVYTNDIFGPAEKIFVPVSR